ncbi:MAG TPA: TlpA disulfide reductase family protein [Actinomycetota bacterium]
MATDPLRPGDEVPGIPEVDLSPPALVAFYKVTCPTCQMAAPPMERLHRTADGGFVAVVQDAHDRAAAFAREYGVSFASIPDEDPYPISRAWGVRVVPTLFATSEGRVEDLAESWDREGWARVAARFGELRGILVPAPSEEGDGLPPFRPG